MKTYNNVKRLAGYTIDQTILIVSVIAVLVTMIIGSVGWDLLTRAGATKLVSHLRQIEQANGQFYAAHGIWPHDALKSSAQNNALCALVDPDAVDTSVTNGAQVRNLLPAYTHDCDTGSVTHSTGNAAAEMRSQDIPTMNDNYLVVELQQVAMPEIIEADKVIDGDPAGSPDSGRIRYDAAQTGKGTIFFIANITDTVSAGTDFTVPGE